jgi:hypothetical protein
MSWTASEPAWVVPSRAQIADLHWLAYAEATEAGDRRALGITAALAWVRGGAAGPATGRAEPPSGPALAEAELWATRAVLAAADPPPLGAICRELGVPYAAPRAIDQAQATGIASTLEWLLGLSSATPLSLPERAPDGRPADVATVVDAVIRAQPHKSWGPEERHAARNHARESVARSRRLLDRIAAAQERAG